MGEPKTDRGRRLIGLDTQLVDVLEALRRRQEGDRKLLGVVPDSHDLVFAHPDGTPLHPESVSRWFSKLVGQAGLPGMRLHDLRHLHATLALAAGVAPRVLADRLGHSTTAMTTDTYQHVLPELDREAAQKVAALVFVQGPENLLEDRDEPGVPIAPDSGLWTTRVTKPGAGVTEYVAVIEGGRGSWSARVPDLPGCAVAAGSRVDVEKRMREEVVACLTAMRERGEPAPGPSICGAIVVSASGVAAGEASRAFNG